MVALALTTQITLPRQPTYASTATIFLPALMFFIRATGFKLKLEMLAQLTGNVQMI